MTTGNLKQLKVPARLAALALVSALGSVLVACGGGVELAGVGTGGTGMTEGQVTGFGSVIVDGVEYQDADATTQAEDANGTASNAEVKLGQRVLVRHDGNGKASAIKVLPQLQGPVAASPDAQGWLQVAGQWVQLVDAARVTASRPMTALDGYASLADIKQADAVVVHGAWVQDRSRGAWVLVASRLEKLANLPTAFLVSGVVQSISGKTLVLNAVEGTRIEASAVPSGLQVGQVVSAWIARNDWGSSPLAASRLTLTGLAGESPEGAKVQLAGLASSFDPAARTVVVQGVKVALPANLLLDTTALQQGAYLRIEGKRGGDMVQATVAESAAVDIGSKPRRVELKGVLAGVDWSAATVRFALRGIPVMAAASVIDAHCKQVNGGADVYVSVEGTVAAPGAPIQAQKVDCESSVPSDGVVERKGVVLSNGDQTLQLQTSQGVLTVIWDERTYLKQIPKPPASLVGQKVEVEGVMTTGSTTLRATKIKRDD